MKERQSAHKQHLLSNLLISKASMYQRSGLQCIWVVLRAPPSVFFLVLVDHTQRTASRGANVLAFRCFLAVDPSGWRWLPRVRRSKASTKTVSACRYRMLGSTSPGNKGTTTSNVRVAAPSELRCFVEVASGGD